MQHSEPIESWYKQFWPWFIISLPASVVVAGIAMIVIAVKNADSLVSESYYKDGLAINRKLDMVKNAERLAIKASLLVDNSTNALSVTLNGDFAVRPHTISLALSHPTDAMRDRTLKLAQTGPNQYSVPLEQPLQGRWYLALSDADGISWKVKAEVDLTKNKHTTFGESGVL